MQGRVRDFDRGYGFLCYDDPDTGGLRYIFVYHSDIIGQRGYRILPVGGFVEFDIVQDARGRRAVNVRLIAGPDEAEC